jgi:hypothetical protein
VKVDPPDLPEVPPVRGIDLDDDPYLPVDWFEVT